MSTQRRRPQTSPDFSGHPEASADVRLPHPVPANDPPAPRTFESLAQEFGWKNTRAVRNWCQRRGVPYWRDGGFSWADRNAVVAAITRPATLVVPTAKAPPPSVKSWVDSTIGGRRG